MPKVKLPRKSTHVDMTAMCDVAFLLLTFFMLTTKFKPVEPIAVVTPSSISTKLLPETNIATIEISKDGRVFFDMDNKSRRMQLIQALNGSFHLGLTSDEMVDYAIAGSLGIPFNQLKNYLNLPVDQQKSIIQPGIPIDTAINVPTNELDQWVKYAFNINPELDWVIKADDNTRYPVVKEVMNTLEENNHRKIHLITSLEKIPPGTVAWKEQNVPVKKK
ncbi:MAG TPA: biopolymer transporter ExbD [Chitinophagaceae bacterium]|nr:biopolymer transporter ExbD [Chitinophagaceae bacterium]